MPTQITENRTRDLPVEALRPSMPDVFSSVQVSRSPQLWRRLLGFIGPGFLISVGYMDPGNWATDLAAGSRYGYTLLFVIMLSNLMAILLQSLAIKLGVATEQDLAQACRSRVRPSCQYRPLDHRRNRHCRLRSGGSDRLGHRAAVAISHPADAGRHHHFHRCPDRPFPAKSWLSVS